MGLSGRFTHVIVTLMFGTGYMQVLYLGRAPRTKEILPNFREKCRVIRHSPVFRGWTGSQRTPGFWGITKFTFKVNKPKCNNLYQQVIFIFFHFLSLIFQTKISNAIKHYKYK